YPAVALLHLVAHAAFKAALFLSAGVAGERADTYALDRMGFGRVLPVTAALSAVAALALAGVPPLGAGWTKEAIVSAAGHDSRWIALAVMVAGGLSAAYGARFQWLAFRPAHEASQCAQASLAERVGIGALAVLTLALSALWLPAFQDRIAQWLGGSIPTSSTLELLVSIAFVGGGLAAGAALATRRPRLGAQGRAAWLADWLGLPVLINRAVIRPTQGAAVIAARLDDAVLDALPRSVGRAGRRAARSLSRRDRLWVDAGVQLTGAFTEWLARIGNRVGEAITDTIPEGTARLVGAGGRLSRMLQSGLSHQYYALLFAGAVLAIALTLMVA
ncbi:MAG TPA: proton-conducting transporter membrane subunit, partial [Steroidobacteraceae bacterium]|nr:proton-conducting transporter membrane subunit [Steroidobacteraceae bacterium]